MLEVKLHNFADSEELVKHYETLHALKGDMTHK